MKTYFDVKKLNTTALGLLFVATLSQPVLGMIEEKIENNHNYPKKNHHHNTNKLYLEQKSNLKNQQREEKNVHELLNIFLQRSRLEDEPHYPSLF
jgi:hypothetical protein